MATGLGYAQLAVAYDAPQQSWQFTSLPLLAAYLNATYGPLSDGAVVDIGPGTYAGDAFLQLPVTLRGNNSIFTGDINLGGTLVQVTGCIFNGSLQLSGAYHLVHALKCAQLLCAGQSRVYCASVTYALEVGGEGARCMLLPGSQIESDADHASVGAGTVLALVGANCLIPVDVAADGVLVAQACVGTLALNVAGDASVLVTGTDVDVSAAGTSGHLALVTLRNCTGALALNGYTTAVAQGAAPVAATLAGSDNTFTPSLKVLPGLTSSTTTLTFDAPLAGTSYAIVFSQTGGTATDAAPKVSAKSASGCTLTWSSGAAANGTTMTGLLTYYA
jgi:hypothetical protein